MQETEMNVPRNCTVTFPEEDNDSVFTPHWGPVVEKKTRHMKKSYDFGEFKAFLNSEVLCCRYIYILCYKGHQVPWNAALVSGTKYRVVRQSGKVAEVFLDFSSEIKM